MALVKCKECSHEVSSKAKKCPNCGANPTHMFLSRKARLIIRLIQGIIFIVGGIVIYNIFINSI
ncbi:hypothetical protein JEZ13_10585 [bacterium]|nr:hypothetical protein [bacterium]